MIKYLFSTKGRLGRVCFLLIGSVSGVALIIIAKSIDFLNQNCQFDRLWSRHKVFMIIGLVLILCALYYAVIYALLANQAKRFHDLNMSGWHVIPHLIGQIIFLHTEGVLNVFQILSAKIIFETKIVSGVGFAIYVILLLFVPGSKNENRFGPADTPSTSE